MTGTTSTSQYARVNGLDMYYEIHGDGRPLILLHGVLSAMGTSFGKLLPDQAAQRQVIAVEMQGHGRTADIERPLRYEWLADDIAALLAQISIETADLFGWSLGAGVALRRSAWTRPNARRPGQCCSACTQARCAGSAMTVWRRYSTHLWRLLSGSCQSRRSPS